MADRQELYLACLLAPLLSWHASMAHYRKIVPGRGTSRLWLLIPAIVASAAAGAPVWSPSAAAGAGLCALILLRMAAGGESISQTLFRGGAVLLFMIPLPSSAVEGLTTGLRHVHVGLAAQLLGPLAGIAFTVEECTLVTEFGTALVISEQCSGAYSLAVLVLFGAYYATTEGHPAGGFLFIGAAAAVLAFVLNVGRVALSCLHGVGGQSFWASPAGHELLGLILAVLGVLLIRALARDVLVRDRAEGLNPVPAPADRPSRPPETKELPST